MLVILVEVFIFLAFREVPTFHDFLAPLQKSKSQNQWPKVAPELIFGAIRYAPRVLADPHIRSLFSRLQTCHSYFTGAQGQGTQ